MKTQMKVLRRGVLKIINCHPHERQFMARFARIERQRRKITLHDLRVTAAMRYC
jgi:hypothetical protein